MYLVHISRIQNSFSRKPLPQDSILSNKRVSKGLMHRVT